MKPAHRLATENSPALILARGLSKTYAMADAGQVTALRNLDFEIYNGEFVSVIGQSGCGKSTLLKLLAGLLPYTSGSLELNGKPLRGPSSETAIVFQSPVLLPWRTILENVLLLSQGLFWSALAAGSMNRSPTCSIAVRLSAHMSSTQLGCRVQEFRAALKVS